MQKLLKAGNVSIMNMATIAGVISSDIYTGYDDYPSVYSTKDLDQDELLQEALKTGYANRPVVRSFDHSLKCHSLAVYRQ